MSARISVVDLGGASRAACLVILADGEEGVTGMQVLYERCAGIDVHKDQVTVAVRVPGRAPGGRQATVRKFGAFYGVLREMARGLAGQGGTHGGMEAAWIYPMPLEHARLEPG